MCFAVSVSDHWVTGLKHAPLIEEGPYVNDQNEGKKYRPSNESTGPTSKLVLI
jgi:hypothetical protein